MRSSAELLAVITVALLTAMPAVGSADAPGWRWVTPHGVATAYEGSPLTRKHNGAEYRLVASKRPEHMTVSRVGGWSVTLESRFVDAGYMVAHGDAIFVSHHSAIASGCTVISLDARSGKERWRTALLGLGPVDHSKYSNLVRLEVIGGQLVAFGLESQGRYVETLDLTSGKRVHNRQVAEAEATLPFSWRGPVPTGPPAPSKGPIVLKEDDATFGVGRTMESHLILARRAGGKTSWQVTVGKGSSTRVALLYQNAVVYCATWSAIATGATLRAVSAGSGKTLWERRVHGLGPIGHSQYYNSVQLSVWKGQVVVTGAEAGGRYVELIKAGAGNTISSQIFR